MGAHAIAAKLTPRQRRALLWLPVEGWTGTMPLTSHAPLVLTLSSLQRWHLAHYEMSLGVRLTPLGVAVREAAAEIEAAAARSRQDPPLASGSGRKTLRTRDTARSTSRTRGFSQEASASELGLS
jgi:hypothetical protein